MKSSLDAAWNAGARWLVSKNFFKKRVPPRARPALFLDTVYNIGSGAFFALFLLTPVALKTVVDGTSLHLAIFAAMFAGSSLLSPLVSFTGRFVSTRTLVVVPNLIAAGLLLGTALPIGGAMWFTLVIGGGFVVRVYPRVAEMDMYRIIYPVTQRSGAVGWLKAIGAISGLLVTLLGYAFFSFAPQQSWMLYWLVGGSLAVGAICYARIPMPSRNLLEAKSEDGTRRSVWEGVRIFFGDRRFFMYQLGFGLAGFANHMVLVFVADVLPDIVLVNRPLSTLVPSFLQPLLIDRLGLTQQTMVALIVGYIFAVLPSFLIMGSSPMWGRFLDRVNPMLSRAVINTLQGAGFAMHAYGGVTLQVWPFLVGAVLHSIATGGGTINWLTGSMYFATPDRVSLYNSIHVALTGLRGLIAPALGLWMYHPRGLNWGASVFWIAATLSMLGTAWMLVQGLVDPGPREATTPNLRSTDGRPRNAA